MRLLKRITTRAVPLIIDDVDTDMIFPAQFATTVGASGFGECLFARERYGPGGQANGTFPLDRAEYRGAEILVSGANFGCGSSREHAVWALRDFGFRCVIAESFADIFYSNCFRNGVLPVPLARDVITNLADRIKRDPSWLITIDLETQTVEGHDGYPVSFAVEPFGRKMLLEGLDEIGLTLEDEPDIALFEDAHVASQPWLRNRKI